MQTNQGREFRPDNDWQIQIETWRAVRTVKNICRKHGFTGDHLKRTNRIGTLGQEWAIIGICLETPRQTRKKDRDLVEQIARNIVLNHDDESTQ